MMSAVNLLEDKGPSFSFLSSDTLLKTFPGPKAFNSGFSSDRGVLSGLLLIVGFFITTGGFFLTSGFTLPWLVVCLFCSVFPTGGRILEGDKEDETLVSLAVLKDMEGFVVMTGDGWEVVAGGSESFFTGDGILLGSTFSKTSDLLRTGFLDRMFASGDLFSTGLSFRADWLLILRSGLLGRVGNTRGRATGFVRGAGAGGEDLLKLPAALTMVGLDWGKVEGLAVEAGVEVVDLSVLLLFDASLFSFLLKR